MPRQSLRCPNCGATLKEGDIVCPKCNEVTSPSEGDLVNKWLGYLGAEEKDLTSMSSQSYGLEITANDELADGSPVDEPAGLEMGDDIEIDEPKTCPFCGISIGDIGSGRLCKKVDDAVEAQDLIKHRLNVLLTRLADDQAVPARQLAFGAVASQEEIGLDRVGQRGGR